MNRKLIILFLSAGILFTAPIVDASVLPIKSNIVSHDGISMQREDVSRNDCHTPVESCFEHCLRKMASVDFKNEAQNLSIISVDDPSSVERQMNICTFKKLFHRDNLNKGPSPNIILKTQKRE